MKNNIIYFISVWVLLTSIMSCTTIKQGYQALPVVSKQVELDPIKADISVAEATKISGTASAEYVFNIWIGGDRAYAEGIIYSSELDEVNTDTKGGILKAVRSAAAYKALDGTGFDILVHPTYKISVKTSMLIFKEYEVTVEGYGAKYVNFRTEKEQKYIITDKDKEYIFTK